VGVAIIIRGNCFDMGSHFVFWWAGSYCVGPLDKAAFINWTLNSSAQGPGGTEISSYPVHLKPEIESISELRDFKTI
jgi:hypothetical protein